MRATFVVCDVRRPILSVTTLCKDGYEFVCKVDEAHLEKNGVRYKLARDGPLWCLGVTAPSTGSSDDEDDLCEMDWGVAGGLQASEELMELDGDDVSAATLDGAGLGVRGDGAILEIIEEDDDSSVGNADQIIFRG